MCCIQYKYSLWETLYIQYSFINISRIYIYIRIDELHNKFINTNYSLNFTALVLYNIQYILGVMIY